MTLIRDDECTDGWDEEDDALEAYEYGEIDYDQLIDWLEEIGYTTEGAVEIVQFEFGWLN